MNKSLQSEEKKESLNILFIVSNNLNWSGKIGGGEIRVLKSAKRLSYKNNVKILESAPSPTRLLGLDLPTITITLPIMGILENEHNNFERILLLLIRFFIWILTSIKIGFDREDIDIVVAANGTLSDLLPAYIIAALKNSPLICYVQITGYGSHNTLKERITLYLLRKATALISVSKLVYKNLICLGFPDSQIILSSNFVDHQYFDSITVCDKKYDACFVGRVEKIKGVEDLIKAWNIVAKKNKKRTLLIIGAGNYYNHAMNIISKYGLEENVKMLGFLPEEEKIKKMKQSRIFIHPSKLEEEGSSLSILEAMACSLPVLSYDNKTHKVLFSECNGFITSPTGNIERLAQNIERLLNMDYMKLGIKCKKFSKRYDERDVLEREFNLILNKINLDTEGKSNEI